jgi:outer membrane protein assembly factor BamB
MSVPSFVPPTLVIFFIALGLFSMILLMRRHQNRGVRAFSHGSTLVLVVFPCLTLFGSLGSLVTLGGLACRTGFYSNAPAPLPSSVLVTSNPNQSGPSLVTLSARDGSVRGEQSLRGNPGGPGTTLSDGVIYFMNHTNLVSAYRISDGSSLWSTALVPPGGEHEQYSISYNESPLVADGMVYVRMSDPHSANSPDRIYALRASNGSIAWTLFHPSLADPDYVTFAAGSGLLVLTTGTGGEGISAYHASNGSLAWKLTGTPFSNADESSPSHGLFFANAMVYFTKSARLQNFDTMIMAIHPGDGQIFWQKDYGEPFDLGPSPHASSFGTHLYLHVSGTLYALDATNGDLLWKLDPREGGLSSDAAVEANGVVYVPDYISLYALHAQDGSLIWKQTGNALSAFGTPLVLQNVLLVSSSQAIFHYFDLNVCPGFSSEPREAIFALNARDGSIYWRSPNTAGPMILSSAP